MRNLIIRWLRLDERYVEKRPPEDLNRILGEIEEGVESAFDASGPPAKPDVKLFNEVYHRTVADLEAASKPVGPSPEVMEEIWGLASSLYGHYGPRGAPEAKS